VTAIGGGERLLRSSEVAEQLGVDRRTVARWTDRGLVPAVVLPSGHRRYRQVDVDAVPEGSVVFPQQPLIRVRGPILQGQLLETALLCLVNFSSLIATKAARICLAAGGAPVLEFGLRRAQGADAGIYGARACRSPRCQTSGP
jgi:excisionase family DNA binding protein